MSKGGLRLRWRRRFYKRPISAARIIMLTVVFFFLNSMLLGVPNASCRYIANAPTNCWLYNFQEGLTAGWESGYLTVVPMVMVASILAIVVGRGWCGWACPFGYAQFLIMRFRARLGLRYRELPYWAVALMDHGKYAILLVMIIISVSIGVPSLGLRIYGDELALPYCQVCPAKPFFTLLQQGVGLEPFATALPWIALAMLIVFLVGAFTVRMFWCRVCPIGAFTALFNRQSLFWLKKEPSKCTKCRVCYRVCPMDIEEVYVEMERRNITSPECIMCGRCVESCPEEGALSMNYMGRELARSRSLETRREEIEGRLECPPRQDGETYITTEAEETEVEE
jgi:ferredoxin-type protein NapH